jgi:hypothetical protein
MARRFASEETIMKRPLQVYLDEVDLARLETWSRERGWTKTQAVRAALRALTRPRKTRCSG